jgi:glycosyltransferase involved in cell wall biosynthesis
MMKVLQVGKYFSPANGGIETISKLLLDNSADSILVDLLCFNTASKTETIQYGKSTVIKCGYLFSVSSTAVSVVFLNRFRKLHKKYQLIHLHTPNPLGLIALYLFRPSCKIVVHWHSDILNKGLLYRLLAPIERSVLKRADIIAGTSPVYIEQSQVLKPFLNKTVAIPLGLQNSCMPVNNDFIEQIKNEYKGKKIVFSLGRFVGYKGFEYLIQAAAFLDDDVVILIGGDGALKSSYEKLIREQQLSSKVRLIGSVKAEWLGNYFSACDLFCLPSCEKTEAFGMVLIEAMSFRKPVLATNIPGSGVSWVNEHGITGINVEPRNIKAVANGITEMLADKEKLSAYGENGYQRFLKNFTEKKMIAGFQDLYKKLVKE